MNAEDLRGFGGDLRGAASFLTALGGGGGRPSPGALGAFPLVGLGIGFALGGVGKLASRALPPIGAASVVISADALLTGALHLDGLADTTDGLLAHAPARSRLEIMARPDLGAFGATALSLALLLRTAAVASRQPEPAMLAALWCLSRSVMVLGTRFAGPYLRGSEGLAAPFIAGRGEADRATASALAGVAAALVLASRSRRGPLAVVAGSAGAGLVLALARRRLGGFTGDVLGAAGVTCETVGLLVLAAR